MEISFPLVLAPVVSGVSAYLLTPVFRALGSRLNLLDVPNDRSSHIVATPRTGGIAIMLAVAAGTLASGSFQWKGHGVLLAGAYLLGVISIIDDRSELPRGLRLATQIALSLLLARTLSLELAEVTLPFIGTVSFGLLAWLITVIWIVGLTNAYNFMDGINGIASLEAIIAGGTLAVLFIRAGDTLGAVLALSLTGAAAGFVPWNLISGSVFMGDVGSAGLGFLLSLLTLRAAQNTFFVAAMLPLLPFLLDAGVTMIRRMLRGERFFSTPHRSHFYQRLARTGWSHVSVTSVWAFLALCAALAGLAYPTLTDPQRAAALVGLIVLHIGVARLVESRWSAREQATSSGSVS